MHTEVRRAILRQTIGTTGVFSLGLILGWPLAVVGAVFTALFLQAPAALPVKVTLKLFVFALLLMLTSWIVSSIIAPYPVVFLGAICIAIILSFTWTVAGAGVLPGVLALMAAMMVPNLVLQSKELALVLVGWIPANLMIAGFVSGLMFTILPAAPPSAAQQAQQMKAEKEEDFDRYRRILRMSLVTVPFAMTFFLLGWSALLVLFFVALLSQQLAAMPAAGKTVAKGMLLANILGAAVAILSYELNVIAPHIITAILLCFLFCLMLGTLAKSDHPLAAAAGSALTTALIIYGGSVAPLSDDADVKSITRVLQVGMALFFVIIAYVVVDEFWPERSKPRRKLLFE